ncbi:MAG: winged helix-turn-helix domain-containing protein [Gammaproteobacteria bacterium]
MKAGQKMAQSLPKCIKCCDTANSHVQSRAGLRPVKRSKDFPMPSGERAPRYRLSDLLVDVGRRTVLRGTHDIRLSMLSFELLRTLIEAAPNVVSNDQLARAVWHGGYVAPETVTQRVKLLRDALSDNPVAPRYIAGLRGHGYRVLPEVTEVSAESEPVARKVVGYQEKSGLDPL